MSLRVYETNHYLSRKICRLFAEGVPDSQVVPSITLLDGDVATYGILRGSHEIILEAKKQDRTWYHIDHGYFHRTNPQGQKLDGYYRVSKNGYQCNGLGDYPSDRWEDLEVITKPWQRKGSHVLVCPMSYNMAIHLGLDAKQWLKDTVSEISKYTDKSIIIKPKSSDMTLEEALLDCHAIVGWDTNALVDAIIEGTPCFNMGPSAVAPVALQDLSKIEKPVYPDRRQWCYNLSYNQFKLEEFKDGSCWRILQENIDNNKELVKKRKKKNV